MDPTKNWCFTLNNPTSADAAGIQAAWDGGKIRYYVFGRETGAGGTPHLQGYLVLKKVARLSAMAKMLPRAHWEASRGTSAQAADYCKKDGDFIEEGTLPAAQGQSEKDRWDEARKAAKEGRMEDIPSDIYIRYVNNLHRIRALAQVVPESVAVLDNWWYYGATGTGKSLAARTENPGYYIKNKNKWWDGYADQPCVIIEEWDPHYSDSLGSFLKEWADHHPFNAEVKGGTMCIRPPKLIVTSNYSMEDCFKDETLLLPLKRRFQIKHFSTLYTFAKI